MSAEGDRRLGLVLGLLGAGLIVLDGLFDAVSGVLFLATNGRVFHSTGFWGQAVLFLVTGFLMGFFAILGRSRGPEHSLTAGVVLVVLVLAGWFVLGLTAGVLPLLGSLLVLIAGILFLLAGQ